MEANVIVQVAADGKFSCFVEEEFADFALAGFGDTPEEAKEDLLTAYKETGEVLAEAGKKMPELNFVWHYDMRSFFEYFDFLKVSKIAERAGINPSLMRQYACGASNAGERQYEKLGKAIRACAEELSAVAF